MQSLSRFCLLFLSFSFVNLARGQLLSFSVNKEPLEKVFLLIEQQSGYNFIYTGEQLTSALPVTVTVTGESLSAVLDKCFSAQPLTYFINDKHILIKTKDLSVNKRTLRGRVVNEEGTGVAGVTVSVQGTSVQTATNQQGEFTLNNVATGAIIVVTGAEIEPLELNTRELPFVQLQVKPKVGTLDETYVIAYGKSSRRLATGSVTSIKKEEITKQAISNPLAILSGRVAGLQVTQVSGTPGSPFIIRLRGQNSIASGNDPLIIVDGVPYPYNGMNLLYGSGILASPLATINPSDIESIEVLKDADATSIYGSRGANGVILITTRKAQGSTTNITIRSYAGFGRAASKIKLLNTPQYIAMRKEAFANDGVVPTSANALDLAVWDTTRYTDWQRELIGNTMHVADTKLEFSGGNAQTRFLFGAGYHGESTVVPDKKFGEEKLSGNVNIQHRTLDQRLRFSLTTAYARNVTKLPRNDLAGYLFLSPNAPRLFNDLGDLNWENSTWQNPLSELRKIYRSESENLMTNLNVSFQLLQSLELKATVGYTMVRVRDHVRMPKSSYDPAQPSIATASFGSTTLNTLIAEPQLRYHKSIKQLTFEALVGSTFQSSTQRSMTQNGSGYSSDDLLHSIAAASQVITGSESDVRYRYIGAFARLSANVKQRYILSLNGRRDGSSRYGPANRFASFGSVGAAWIFSQEPLLGQLSWLSHGKLKASAGVTGNDQIGDYNYLDIYNASVYPYQGVIGLQPRQLFNPTFNWEKVTKYEVGIDLGLLANRILLSSNYYINTSDNQLVQYGLPPSSGFSGILRNLPARVRNTGVELELSATVVKSKNWQWQSSFNITFPKNKLIRFDNLASSSYANTYVVGQPLFIAKTLKSEGVDPATGYYRFHDFDRSGAITTPNDQQRVVFTGQEWFGGWQNSLNYRQLSLSFLVQFTQQKNAYSYVNLFPMPGSFNNQPVLVMDRWQKPGDNSAMQRFSVSGSDAGNAFFYYRSSDAAYSNASFLRLKNIYLSYSFDRILGRKLSANQCTIFLQAQNVFTISSFESIDPETRSAMPPIRMFTGGFQLSF